MRIAECGLKKRRPARRPIRNPQSQIRNPEMPSLSIKITDTAKPQLAAIADGLKNKRPMLIMVGNRVRNLIRDHLIQRSLQVRNKLGAPTSGFWAKQARNVSNQKPEVAGDTVAISLEGPGMARAFGPLTIRPKPPKKFLTIPLIAQAYNKRAYRIADLFAVVSRTTGKGVLLRRGKNGVAVPWYALVKQVHQTQDRSILPTDPAITEAAEQGIGDYVEKLLEAKQ